jgi:CBS domain-containing protein
MAKVRNKMSFDVVTIEAKRSVIDAAKRMLEEKKGALPVTEDGKLVGIFTDRDIVSLAAQNESVAGKDVRSVMTQELVTISPDQDVDDARQLMTEHQLDRILVTYGDGDRLVGIISEADIRSDEGPVSGGTDTVGGVTEPVSGVTDTVSGATDKLLGGGGEKQR